MAQGDANEANPLAAAEFTEFMSALDQPNLSNMPCFAKGLKAKGVLMQSMCEPGFIAGQPHIQHKFCKNCRIGFAFAGRVFVHSPPTCMHASVIRQRPASGPHPRTALVAIA